MQTIYDAMLNMSAEQRLEAVATILAAAREDGFEGFGGNCFAAAIALNRVLFGGKGTLVAGLNEFFLAKGHPIGHGAVLHDGIYWDADGRPKDADDIESWGMLDHLDPDWIAAARRYRARLTEARASEAAVFEMNDELEMMELAGHDVGEAATLEMLLDAAAAKWLAARSQPVP
jgi:hypothetical protein